MMTREQYRTLGYVVCALAFCHCCQRVEFMRLAGPFFYRCDECQSLVPKDLRADGS